jgi:Ni/Co efflux regulator RcnB
MNSTGKRRIALFALLAFGVGGLTPAAFADPPGGKAGKKQEQAARKQAREQSRAIDRQDRASLKALREQQREARKTRRIAAGEGWYDGSTWKSYEGEYRYRDAEFTALQRYTAPTPYLPPVNFEMRVFEPGVRLPSAWVEPVYYVEHVHYRLPPPPPQHRWVRVDDDVVLVALASGLVADIVYDLFR